MTCHRQVIHYAPPPVCGRASSHHPSALIRGNTSVVSLHISGAPKIMCIGAPTAAAISETNRSIRRILHGFTAKNHTSIRPPTCLKICRLSVMDKEQPVKDSIYPCRIIQVQIVPRQNGAAKTMSAHSSIYIPVACDDPIMLGSVVRFRAFSFCASPYKIKSMPSSCHSLCDIPPPNCRSKLKVFRADSSKKPISSPTIVKSDGSTI